MTHGLQSKECHMHYRVRNDTYIIEKGMTHVLPSKEWHMYYRARNDTTRPVISHTVNPFQAAAQHNQPISGKPRWEPAGFHRIAWVMYVHRQQASFTLSHSHCNSESWGSEKWFWEPLPRRHPFLGRRCCSCCCCCVVLNVRFLGSSHGFSTHAVPSMHFAHKEHGVTGCWTGETALAEGIPRCLWFNCMYPVTAPLSSS
jgi:hypothetical protein